MPTGLTRNHNQGHDHLLTFSCFRHRPILGTPEARTSSCKSFVKPANVTNSKFSDL